MSELREASGVRAYSAAFGQLSVPALAQGPEEQSGRTRAASTRPPQVLMIYSNQLHLSFTNFRCPSPFQTNNSIESCNNRENRSATDGPDKGVGNVRGCG